MKTKNIIAVVFARSGSKGLKNKNIKEIKGKPLIAWSILHAKSVREISRVIVSTDSKKIAAISQKYGAETPFLRPKELAADNSPEILSWKHVTKYLYSIEKKLPDAIISVPATSPLRKTKDLKDIIDLFFLHNLDVGITITAANRNPWFNMVETKKDKTLKLVNSSKKNIYRRQDAKQVYDMTTIAFIFKPKFILKNNNIFSGRVMGLEIPKERALDIDDRYDFEIAEYLMRDK